MNNNLLKSQLTSSEKYSYLDELNGYGISGPQSINMSDLIIFLETDPETNNIFEGFIKGNGLSKEVVLDYWNSFLGVFGVIKSSIVESDLLIPVIVIRFPTVIAGATEILALGLFISILSKYINTNHPRIDSSIGTNCIVDARNISDVSGATISLFVTAKEIASRFTNKFYIVSKEGFIYNFVGQLSLKIIRTKLKGMNRHMAYTKNISTAIKKIKSIDNITLKFGS